VTGHLAARRADLARTLSVLPARVLDHVPEQLTAPAAIIQAGDPYLDVEGATFGAHTVHYLVSLVVEVGANQRMTNELDALIGAAVVALDGAYGVEQVTAPYPFTYNTATYLAVNVHLSDEIRLTEEI